MRILALSPYQAYSHRLWIEQLVGGFPDIDWDVLGLPPRHFHWRVRSNPLHWRLIGAFQDRRPPDLLLATSMTDLATLKGLFRRELGRVPAIVYFHENQFAYPLTPGATDSVEPRMVNLYSALAADRVVFNSEHNRRTFLEGAERFLARMPDRLPAAGLRDIEAVSEVIPVPVRRAFYEARPPHPPAPHRLVWNHRWEHDKGVDRLLAAVGFLAEAGVELELALAGQRFRSMPPAMQTLVERFAPHVTDAGFISEPDYPRWLARGGLALSTAVHDFQGLAVQEAVASGCVPVVPDRLAYPEWFDPRFRYVSRDDPEADGWELARHCMTLLREPRPPAPALDGLRFEVLAGRYRELFNSTA